MTRYSWSNRPMLQFKGRAVLGIIIIAASGIVLFWASDNNIAVGIVAIMLMLFSSSRFYFPTSFYADDIGIGEKFLGYSRVNKWEGFKRVEVGELGLFLSPFRESKWLERFRGWTVPTPNDEIKDFIVRKIEETSGKIEKADVENVESLKG